MTKIKITLPSWLFGPVIQDLRLVFERTWQSIFDLMDQKMEEIHDIRQQPDEMIRIQFEDLPIKPFVNGSVLQQYADFQKFLNPAEQRTFLLNYRDYIDGLGTDNGILLAAEIFGLDSFKLLKLYNSPLSDQQTWFALQIRMDWKSADERKRIREFVSAVAPSRCKFHKTYLPPVERRGLGYTKLGRTLGL
ncbi:MAG: hypothetical protein JKX96_04295 [Acinetobacter sp.]|nr:hypothetical protein [Acinetobacter sp.]